MATGGGGSTSGHLYEEDNVLDERLLNLISKWILYNRLPSLARHLGFSYAEISRIITPLSTPDEQCFQIIKKWKEKKGRLTVEDLMEAMVEWHHERYLDPEVWNRLPEKINPALMPAPSVLQSLPPPPPPGGVEYSALHHLPDPSRGTRLPLEYHSEGQIVHHEEEVVIRTYHNVGDRYTFVEEIARRRGQHLQTSRTTTDQAPFPSNTTEYIPASTTSNVPETRPPFSSAPRFAPTGTCANAPVFVLDPTSSEAPASVQAPTFFRAPVLVPFRTSSKVPASIRAPNIQSAQVFFPPPTFSSAPESHPDPTASDTPETCQAQTASNTPETVQAQTGSNTPETVPDPTASNAPETHPDPTAFSAQKTVPASTASNPPGTLPPPTWSNTSRTLPSKSSCQPDTVPVTTSGDAQITSGLESLTIGGVSSAPCPEFVQLQKKLTVSLHRTWKHALMHDWISPEKAKSLPLHEFYVGLRWTKMVKDLENYKKEMTSIYDILTIIDPDEELRPVNIFIEAEPGMGKTCSLALLALKWVERDEYSYQ